LAVSQHLATLRLAGLISERRAGRHTYYRVEPDLTPVWWVKVTLFIELKEGVFPFPGSTLFEQENSEPNRSVDQKGDT
jgi:DNA-binding transcriptional ArsR family regulator